MSEFGTGEWLGKMVGVCSDTGAPGVEARVAVTVEKAPTGKVRWTAEIADDGLAGAEPGAARDADIALTVGYEDLVSCLSGEVDPSVMFMRGDLKVAGDTGRFFDLLPWMESEPVRRACRRLGGHE